MDIWINISEANANKMLGVLNDLGIASMGFKKQDFLKVGYISQIGYPPLRIDILNSIDGVDFDKAVTNMQKITIEHGLTINYIGLNEFVKK